MFRQSIVVIALMVFGDTLLAQPTLAEARLRWLKGNYAESREQFAELMKLPANRVAAAIGMSRAWESEGRYSEALQVVEHALQSESSADLLARRAELHYRLGDAAKAKTDAQAALAKKEDCFLARWVRACLAQESGDYDAADADFRWFVRTYVSRNRAAQDIKDPDELLIVALAGAENARWHQLPDQFKFILNEVIGDTIKTDSNYWPAECLAGQLLREKWNKAEALAAFDKVLAINPQCVEAIVGKGQVAYELFELADADRHVSRALEINPQCQDAMLLQADIAWSAGQLGKAREVLQSCRQPHREAVLGRLAAIARITRDEAAIAKLDKAAKELNPKPARFEYECGRWLDARSYFAAARAAYLRATTAGPHLTPARAQLALLAFRMGDEDEARKLLRDAFQADPFHVRLGNSLKVLRQLDKYETIKTEHFIVRFDPKTDAVLGAMLAEYLETTYQRLAQQFEHRPAGPFIVEAFSTHEMFSGRIVAGPDLHTVGATTGRVLAMSAPKAQGVKKPFNWARVLRHELMHIFNLDQSDYLVSHWLTEGLAVQFEGHARPAEWLRILAARAASQQLLTVATLNHAFTHPANDEERLLAYCQAQLLVEYLINTYGADVPVKMLRAYARGHETPAALPAACGAELPAIESGYRAYVTDFVAKSGAKPLEKKLSIAQLEALLTKNPNDADASSRLAEQYLRRKRLREAREYVDAALKIDPRCGLAIAVRAQLNLDSGNEERAIEMLTAATDGDTPHPQCLRLLGRTLLQAGQTEQAMTAFERGNKLEPAEPEWLADLARTAKQAGEFEKAARYQAEYLLVESDDLEGRRDQARLLMELNRPDEAARFAREALEIDPADDAAQELLLTALAKADRKAELEKWKALLKKNEAAPATPPKG